MTDAEYILHKDTMQKKSIARSYYSKKGGKGSSKCRLSSDNITDAQWKRRNGEISTLRLNEKLSYNEFKKLSENYQELYIKNLVDKHGARMRDIASMMGCRPNALSAHIRKYTPTITFDKKRVYQTDEWRAFLNGEKVEDEKPETKSVVEPVADTGNMAEEIKEEAAPVVADNSNDNKSDKPIDLDVNTLYGNVTFKGEPYAVFTRAVKMFDEGKKYTITIGFREEEEDAEERA